MDYVATIVAAFAGFAFGAVWYMTLTKPWMGATGIKTNENGQPEGAAMVPYVMALVAMMLVSGMMRHTFALSGIKTGGKGLISGLGIGLFFMSPWIMFNNGYTNRPFKLTLIDSGYAMFGCAIIGSILTLF